MPLYRVRRVNILTMHYGPVYTKERAAGQSLTLCKSSLAQNLMTNTVSSVDCKACLELLNAQTKETPNDPR